MPPKKNKKCHRCGKAGHVALQGDCKDTAFATLTDPWNSFPHGQPFQADGDEKECKAVLRSAGSGDKHNGDTLTKQMLEAAFLKAFGKPAHPVPSPVGTQTTATPATASQTNAQQGASISTRSQKSITAPAATPQLPIGQLPPWKLSFTSDKPLMDDVAFERTDADVWDKCPIDPCEDKIKSAQRGAAGRPIKIVTNYVAVNQVPKKLYIYSVKYVVGQKTDVTAGATALSSLQSLSTALPAGAQTIAGGTGDDREVKRRSEKRHVFESLRNALPFSQTVAPVGLRKDWATDFDTVWSLTPLQFPESSTAPPKEGQIYPLHNVQYHKATGRSARLDRVEFTFTRMLEFTNQSATHALLNSGLAPNAKGASLHIAALNGLVSRHATDSVAGITQIGPNKFFLTNGLQRMPHPEGRRAPFNAHRGYYSSIRPGSEKVVLNVSAKAGTFINPMKVSDFLNNIGHPKYNDYGNRPALLISRTVRICYHRTRLDPDYDPNEERNRHKTIAGFGTVPSTQMFFNQKAGREMSVKEYFTKELGAPEPNNAYPCVNVGMAPRTATAKSEQTGKEGKEADGKTAGKERREVDEKKAGKERKEVDEKTVGKELWIPADFVELEPNQPFSKQLSPLDMDSMLRAAQHRPAQVQSLIVKEGFRVLGLTLPSAGDLAHLGLSITPRLLEIPGRMLPSPTVAFRNITTVPVNAASWMLVDQNKTSVKFVRTSAAGTTATALPHGIHVFDFCWAKDLQSNNTLAQAMTQRLVNHGVMIPSVVPKGYTRVKNLLLAQGKLQDQTDHQIANIVSQQYAAWKKPQLFLVVLDDTNSANYAKVKRVFDQHVGLQTVCLTAPRCSHGKSYSEPDPQLLSNLALKFNLKLGGQNHQVISGPAKDAKSAFSDIAADTIVMGADVSHAPSQMSDCPSVAAVVGSIDKDFSTFPGSMRLQASGQEEIEELTEMVAERVIAYAKANQYKQLPKRMIFYRDGVGEDQFDMSTSGEIGRVREGFNQARSALKNLGFPIHSAELDLTFIVVGKRHHTRFFCTKENQSKREKTRWNGNVLPGLIVDSVITRPPVDKKFDFFLQSHQALKGMAKSAHYIVLEKGTFTPDKIQTLTHDFCYIYARATKGVSYASPAYYADRLAERGTHYFKAYTTGRQAPPWQKTDAEKTKDGLKVYQKRVAAGIAQLPEWNPNPTNADGTVRKNPWHPNMDKIMFWL
ncbi:hypothetical protein B0A55_00607 [Friedmanniomyces simplex]|uniref:Piwi domain-containing protein n=1 Tax=Friedmanniomyces simplex TaxID=329884 RepID=A0A4U0Y3G7_9PEZI|nr:hypothetical protein B0A55_00607 [Friedmanniomyces simplex]